MEGLTDRLSAMVERHCAERGFSVVASHTDTYGYRRFWIDVPGSGLVRLRFNGEVFLLTFPGGYSWVEFASHDEDRDEALEDLLAFLDAFADPRTQEVSVSRRLRADRRELHVSNGAILRVRGWSRGPH